MLLSVRLLKYSDDLFYVLRLGFIADQDHVISINDYQTLKPNSRDQFFWRTVNQNIF